MKKPQDETSNLGRLSPNLSRSCENIDSTLVTNYELMKEQKQKEALQLQQELLAEQERQALLIAQTNSGRSDLLSYLAKVNHCLFLKVVSSKEILWIQANADLDARLLSVSEKNEMERRKMLEVLRRSKN